MSDSFVTEWRGPAFPDDPISGQMFFLDVANGATPPRGWYEFRTTISSPTAAGTWTLTGRSIGDKGDLVRPVADHDNHEGRVIP